MRHVRRWLLASLALGLVALLLPARVNRASESFPVLRDLAGRLRIGCGFDAAVSAPEVCARDGHVLGVYLDDETPNLPYWVALAVTRYPSGLVIVARSMGQHGCPFHGVLCAQEWYPRCSGTPAWAWGPMPREHAYILQDRYGGYGGCDTQPPRSLVRGLIRQARRHRPRLILLY